MTDQNKNKINSEREWYKNTYVKSIEDIKLDFIGDLICLRCPTAEQAANNELCLNKDLIRLHSPPTNNSEWWFLGYMDRTPTTPVEKDFWLSDCRIFNIPPTVEYANGSLRRWLNGQLHCTNGPAAEYINGRREWWVHGTIHRIDGPAVEYRSNYECEWWVDGQRHRIDGPAVIASKTREWWVDGQRHRIDGQRHRIDGPAVIASKTREWWVYGQRHRIDGPAIIHKNDTKEWWVDGQRHRIDGQRHRIDGPAIIHKNDIYSDADGPAVEHADGYKEWWLNGQINRADGPAIVHSDNRREWLQNGCKMVYYIVSMAQQLNLRMVTLVGT
jgi:hypothetical protein